jgi:hypothetical protein
VISIGQTQVQLCRSWRAGWEVVAVLMLVAAMSVDEFLDEFLGQERAGS